MLGEVLTAIVTPFKDDGSVDYESFRKLALYLVEHGSDGLVVTGTTGEGPTLSDVERMELYSTALETVGDRATVVAGTGTYSTSHSVHLTEQAHELGVHGVLVVTPYYNKPPQRGIVEHFKAVAAATDRPVMVYNIPSRVVINIEPETMTSSRRSRTSPPSSRRTTTSTRRATSSSSASTSTPATTTWSSRSCASAASAACASTRTLSARW